MKSVSAKLLVGLLTAGMAVGGVSIAGATSAEAAPITSTWWAGAHELTQAYGCSPFLFEPRPPTSKAICPQIRSRFHTGVDIGFGRACGASIRTPVPVTVMAVGGFDRNGRRYSGGSTALPRQGSVPTTRPCVFPTGRT